MISIATKIPAELKRQVNAAIAQYPPERKRSAALPLLHLWQEHFGFISDEGVNWIADKLELQPINILELVTFYPMLRQKSAGKTHIRVCRTLSCAMAGSYRVMENLCATAGITHGQSGLHDPFLVSKDGKVSVEFVECLASCGTAPVCMVDAAIIRKRRFQCGVRSFPQSKTCHTGRGRRPVKHQPSNLASSTRAPACLQKYRPLGLDARHQLLPG